MFKENYSKLYDFIYSDKNYEKECDFIEEIFVKFNEKPNRILDLGCGTGQHAIILAKRGYEVLGVDRSKEMINIAKAKAKDKSDPVRFIRGDITSVNLNEKFDAVISMFAVISYQTTNESLSKSIETAKKHLAPGGIFTFDCWNGLAVLIEKPEDRIKEIDLGDKKIIRETKPVVNFLNQTVEVRFRVREMKKDKMIGETNESHLMRFLFPQEIKYFLETAGFSQVEFCPFLELNGTLSERDWNMSVIAKGR